MDKEYTKREIDMLMKDIHEKLDLILAQTTKTNGRVTKIENWKAWVIGYAVAMTPVVTWMAYQIIELLTHNVL